MVQVAIDARVGGEFVIVERREGEDVAHTGRYLEIDPPRHLTFTLQVPKYSDDVDRVTIRLEPIDTGCRLELTHTMDARWADYADRTRDGWAGILEHLATCFG
jgi:uncharacterized protein YndB with AHSA1/START domain